MSNKGFASIYALGMLQLVLVFCLFLSSCAISMSVSKREDSLHKAQLYAIYRVKKRLSMVIPVVTEEDEAVGDHAIEDEFIDESQEDVSQVEQYAFTIDQEEVYVYDHHIVIQYQEEAVMVEIDSLRFQMDCDLKKQIILDLVYNH